MSKKAGHELQEHIRSTYFSLRWGMVVIAIIFPVLLAGFAYFMYRVGLQPSLSAYYETRVRDLFVGSLFAVGACLYLYKGFSDEENYALNASGVLALGVALFPLKYRPWGEHITPHGLSAILFFLGIAWVCLRCAKDTLEFLPDPAVRSSYERRYKAIGIAMILVPAAAWAVNVVWEPSNQAVFWAEVAAIYVFAFYWFTKSRELGMSSAEARGLMGAGSKASGKAA